MRSTFIVIASLVAALVTPAATAATPSCGSLTAFSPAPTIGSGSNGTATANFNGDGRLDLAVANTTANTVSVLLSAGNGSYSATTFAAGSRPYGIAAGDFNGDGRIDLAVTNDTVPGAVRIFLGNGLGAFVAAAGSPYTVLNNPRGIVAGDFDPSIPTRLDLAVTNYGSNAVSILLGNGNGTFSLPAPAYTWSTGTGPWGIVSGFFNNDANLDLAVANYGSASVTLLSGDGTGHFPTRTDFPVGSSPRSLATALLNIRCKILDAAPRYSAA